MDIETQPQYKRLDYAAFIQKMGPFSGFCADKNAKS